MQTVGFGQQNYTTQFSAAQSKAPGAAGQTPKFGCLVESAVGCCAVPALGLLGFALFKLTKFIKGLFNKTPQNRLY